jgi:predicted nuclease of predicted toxin-antitoxin system
MADKAFSSISSSVLLDDVRSSVAGSLNYEPKDANDKWVFAEVAVNNSSSDLLTVTNDFLASGVALTTADKIYWIAIKNLSTTSTDGIGICLDAGAAAYDLGDGIFIGAGEVVILKCPNTTVANLHAISVAMDGTYGYPSGAHSGSVTVHVAAIIDDVA